MRNGHVFLYIPSLREAVNRLALASRARLSVYVFYIQVLLYSELQKTIGLAVAQLVP